jgi:FeS assembly protein SufD
MPTLSPLPHPAPTRRHGAWIDALLESFARSDGATSLGALAAGRQAARLALVARGFPSKREEAWRFTDLAPLNHIPPRPCVPGASGTVPWPAPSEGICRLNLNRLAELSEVSWPEGVAPLGEHDLESRFGQILAATACSEDWSVLLNSALSDGVIALRIAPGSHTALELVSDLGNHDGIQPLRLLLVVEEGASLQLVQAHRAQAASLTSVVLEVDLAHGATLHHGLVGHGGDSAALLALTAVRQAPGSHYAHTSVSAGWAVARQQPLVTQSEGQAITRLRGLQWVRGHQLADTHSRVRFDGVEGSLDQLHKAVAEDEARSVFNGCVEVPRAAQRTNACQLSRGLLLSERARIDTKPQLEIVADDVRCTHGATISRLRQEELFYLQSRGLGAAQSARLLLRGFCEEVAAELPAAARAWNPLTALLEEAPSP